MYTKFRNGEITTLAVSKVGNFAVDLPDANVMVQLSGTFGSRQEEAQRLGESCAPGRRHARALLHNRYAKTRDQEFGANRQLFLVEQGYRYRIVDGSEILRQFEVAMPAQPDATQEVAP